MKACMLRSPAAIETNPLECTEVPMPQPKSGEVLVRVRACGVCRTDLHVIEGELPPRKSPVIPGHQVVGVIEKRGEGAQRFAAGARVGVAWLYRTDGTCEYCRSGAENLCDNPGFTGYSVDGGYADYIVAPEDFVYTIPESRYGFPGLKQEGDWVFTASALRRMWRFKWRDIGESKFMLLREMRATRNWRWNWARYGPEERLTSRQRNSTPQSCLRRQVRLFPLR